MQNTLHQSRRHHQGKAAAYSAAFGVETLESRQFMSIVPFIAPIGTVHVATSTATTAPLAVNGTTGSAAVRVDAQAAISTVAPGNGVVPPSAGGNTVAAKSLWGRIKGAAKWAKDHIVIGLDKIGIKGTWG